MSEAATELSGRLKEQIKSLIIAALREKYISTSSHMNYTTGNAYQALNLGGEQLGGYRHDRSQLFMQFNFSGRRVLGGGCNLGELSRLARWRGASFVDGIEYDDYFVQIAQLVNAYHGTTRVSFSQGDLTKAETIKDTYDVSLTFSVFPYILPVLEKLAASTREALILETHNVTSDLRKMYIEPVSRYFPHHTFVEYTDFGKGEGRRAVFVFAKKQETLLSGDFMSSTIDIAQSDLTHIDAMRDLMRSAAPDGQRSKEHVARLVAETGGTAGDLHRLTAGKAYWLEMMKGYLQAEQEGRVTPQNSYVMLLRDILTKYDFDPALSEKVSSEDALISRVEYRFADVSRLAASSPGQGEVDPLTIVMCDEPETRFRVHHGQTGATINAKLMDGYHRTFWAEFFGVRKLRALYTI